MLFVSVSFIPPRIVFLFICTLDCVCNFSDHRPILARCDLHLGGLATTTALQSKYGSLIVWDNASNEDLQHYSRLVCQRLDDLTLADSIVYCINLVYGLY